MSKIIHIHLKQGPHNGKVDWYFGSFSAVPDHLPKEVTGVSDNYLRDQCRVPRFFENKRIRVDVGELISSPCLSRRKPKISES